MKLKGKVLFMYHRKLIIALLAFLLFLSISQSRAELENSEYSIDKLMDRLEAKESGFKTYVEKIKKSYDSSMLDSFIKEANSETIYIRIRALICLIEIKDNRSVDSLITLLKNEKMDFASTRLIVYALGEFKDTHAIESLIMLLKNRTYKETENESSGDLADSIIDALVKIGKPSEQSLLNLLNDKSVNVDIQSWAAKGLAELGNSSITNLAIDFLKNENPYIKSRAARSLGILKDTSAVEPLIAMLKEGDSLSHKEETEKIISALGEEFRGNGSWGLRDKAAWALGQIKDPRAVEPLISAINDIDAGVRKEAVKSLGEIGDSRAIESLVTIVKFNFKDLGEEAINALIKINKPSIESLISLLKDTNLDSWNRGYLLRVIHKINDPLIVDTLTDLLRVTQDQRFKVEILWALEKIKDPKTIDSIIILLNDKYEVLRENAVRTLGEIGDKAIPALISALKNENSNVRNESAKTLVKIGEQAVATSMDTVKNSAPDIQRTFIWALGGVKEKWAIKILTSYAESKDKSLQKEAVGSLERIGNFSVEALISIAIDKESNARHDAIRALGAIKDVRAVESLTKILNEEENGDVIWALGELKDPRGVDSLFACLKSKDSEVRANSASALGAIKDPRALEYLITALEDKEFKVREKILYAFGEIGDSSVINLIVDKLNKDKNLLVRSKAAYALDKLNWKPQSIKEKAYYFAAKENWNECLKLGRISVEPLLNVLGYLDNEGSKAIIGILGEIGDSRAIEPLFNIFRISVRNRFVMSQEYLENIATALSKMKEPKIVEILNDALKDKNIAKLAEKALEKLNHNKKDKN